MTFPTDRALTPEELREWLDRRPPSPSLRHWRNWFSDYEANYWGEVSARTGPDAWATAEQSCSCSQCQPKGDNNG
jgi:hypothetical protein